MGDSDPDSSLKDSLLNLKAGLSDALDSIQSSGMFAAFEQLDGFVDPEIFVPGIGSIQLPLQEPTARSLIQTCHQAPFGKGEHTIYDTSVRNTWELDANQFELRNPAWAKYIKKITRSALKELGFDEDDMFGVRAELYKLLLSEKTPGMFGTLVVCLPSPHEGGWVKLQHAEETKLIRTDLSNPSYACWYSDVVHEVTPLTKGYRFVLTFNLTADPQGARASAQMNFDAHDGVRRLLRQWQSDIYSSQSSLCELVIHLLDHEYTEQGLKLQSLKGRDLDVVRAIREACSATRFLCFLASCEKTVYGGCEDNYSYRGRYHSYDDSYDDCHEIVEVYDTSLCLKRIVDMNGKLVAENVGINKEDFLNENPFDGRAPDDEDYSGYTGNEGVSATQYYRHTAIVIVPKMTVAGFLMDGSAIRETIPSWSSNNKTRPSFDAENLFCYFQRLLEVEPDDSYHTKSLRDVCEVVLSGQAIFSQAIIHRATEIAAQLGDLDLLELAMSSHQDYLTPAIAPTIGKCLSSVALDRFKKVLTEPINSLKKIYKRHEVIQSLTAALLEEGTDQPKQDVDAKIGWLVSTMDDLLAASDSLEADDAKALFEMLGGPRSLDNFLDQLEAVVQRNNGHTLFMINFLAGLCQDGHGERYGLPQERAASIFKLQFPEFCARFDIPQSIGSQNKTVEPARSILPPLSYLSHIRPPRAEEPTITAHWKAVSDASVKLPHLFRQALELCPHGQADAILNVIRHAADTYDVKYFKHLFLPFLRGMLPVWNAKGIALSNPICQDLYQSVLASYSRRFVGEKPLCPEDWSMIRVPCPCRDCELLNKFVTSPTQKVGRFPMAKSRRMHLHQQLDRAAETYTHVTERIGSPQTLIVTKTRKEWESKVMAWEMRRAEARDEFKSFGLEKLRELLGDRFQNILTGLSNTESGDERVTKRQKVGATRYGHHDQILSSLYGQNVSNASTVGGAGTKRKITGIIDLTNEL